MNACAVTSRRGLRPIGPWLFMLVWCALQALIARQLHSQQRGPVDSLSYQTAAERIGRGESPYATAAEDLAIWRAYHQLEKEWRDRTATDAPVLPGPYLYPPTLALAFGQTGIGPVAWAGITVLSVIAFVSIWLTATGMRANWLLFVVLSWDVFAAASGGNVELVLLGATIAAARILWSARPAFAAPLIAVILLVKPFYILFFAALTLTALSTRRVSGTRNLAGLVKTSGLTLVLITGEVYRWGPTLRVEALEFMRHGIDHQWFVLPVAEQTPMSIWNRTPMQGFVSAGVSPAIAFPSALALWCAFAGVTVWRVSKRPLEFSRAFALSFVLLYLGRPIGWTLNYLEIVVLAAVWPAVSVRMRRALMTCAVAVMISHWLALVLTAQHVNLRLFTLQSAAIPWETWLLLPLCWFLLLHAERCRPTSASCA